MVDTAESATSRKTIPTYCNQCVSGPDLMRIEVENGVATRIEPNYDIANEHPGGGRICVKAYGMLQKTYNPNRIAQPMKRTNPNKGRDEDPGFVPISWDEALDTVAGKLRDIRAKGLLDESGFPRFAATFGGGGTPTQFMGTFPAFLKAWGATDLGFGAGQGVKCTHSEHLYGELWHRAFTVAPDTPYCEYVIACGANLEAAAGVVGVWREANARGRGLKRVQVEPHLSVSGALSAEWLPIKPKTDAAFLFALINRIICELDWRQVCDVPFLENDTVSPYLVGPQGYYLRDVASRKPLIWDLEDDRAKPFDAEIGRPAMEGSFRAQGFEEGADMEEWSYEDGVEVKPAFQMLKDHVSGYSADWAAGECDVPAARIRQVADEFLAHAHVGETIEIEGETLPFRPVSIVFGRNVNNGWGGYHCCWARTMLACLVGSLEVVGGTLGTTVKLNRPAENRQLSATPHPDGIMHYPFNETTKQGWAAKPHIRNAYRTLVPLASDSPWSAALGPAHLPWLFLKQQPENWPVQTRPEIWFCYRTNPAISSWSKEEVAERISEFPYVVAFAYTPDETNHFADILLPEATDLEGLQLIRLGGTKFQENFWRSRGWVLRQPVIEPPVDCMDMTDISTELARRVGILEDYNAAINSGAGGMRLQGEDFDYSLDTSKPHDREEIWDAVCKAASHDTSAGREVHDLEWFKEHGYHTAPFPQLQWYLYPHMKAEGLRFEMPYQERIKRHGQQLGRRMHEVGINWWEKQIEEYEPLPTYERFPDIWLDYVRDEGGDPDDYPFVALTSKSMQYAWGSNAGIPLMAEAAGNVAGHNGLVVNRGRANELGIDDGDPVVIESVAGRTEGFAVLRDGIRPEVVLMIGQFEHWKTPIAKDIEMPSLNSLTPLSLKLTDSTGSGSDHMRVKLSRGHGRNRFAA